MQNILLLEPDYKNKFPPIGLMKLSSFHKNIRGDFVWFSKGRLPSMIPAVAIDKIKRSSYYQNRYCDLDKYIESAQDTIGAAKWDRIYVTTLFTFEWKRTVELIKYAKSLVYESGEIIVGGIAATLMPGEIESETGIKPVTGLIRDCSQIGYGGNICVDTMIPDYAILDHVAYDYPAANSYFLTATRGCGMKCSFCAVQTLEPDYIDYIPITPRVEAIRKLYGDKRDLCLLDNNVLKSAKFKEIIGDIKRAGFYKGAVWINPKTGKENKRRVDFNQGLDANFFTEDKAKLLSGIALDPCHIAFDHIDDKAAYLKAANIADKYDIRSVTSYLLYNTSAFNGKGKAKKADTPQDLYDRIQTTMLFNETSNTRRKAGDKPPMYTHSFPMKFAPLGCKARDFVGDNWNRKLLCGVKAVLQPSRGGAYSRREYFEHMYGSCYAEFERILLMPLMYVKHKGKPIYKYPGCNPPNQVWLDAMSIWQEQYLALNHAQRKAFHGAIADNIFNADLFMRQNDPDILLLLIHYYDGAKLLDLLSRLYRDNPVLHDLTRCFLLDHMPVLAANIELLEKHKQGEREIALLLELVFTPSLALAG